MASSATCIKAVSSNRDMLVWGGFGDKGVPIEILDVHRFDVLFCDMARAASSGEWA